MSYAANRPSRAIRLGRKDDAPSESAGAGKAPKSNRVENVQSVLATSMPQVDLLPPEIRAERKAKSLRRALVYAVIGMILLVILACGAASALAAVMQASVVEGQATTASLLGQQNQYGEARQLKQQVATAEAAQSVGASTEIDWQKYVTEIQLRLPAGVALNTITIDSSSPLALYAQPSSPLQGARVATVAFSVLTPTPDISAWLVTLAQLPGYADAVPGAVTLDETTGLYQANVTLHLNQDAFDKRFSKKGE
ncbi:hypothetical protein ACIRCZ_16315 [Leifsonia sp. NPDC102414]|uniref:hypothetical protein n=1 Tax=Leifsonia sp. NPDC102414 TaxID=3364124 RepID=UPI003828C254